MSLFENLNSIYSIKNDIKSVLENKGVDMTNYSFPDYPSVISDLSTGGNMSTLSVSVNGTYYPEAGYDGFSEVSVNVIPNLGYDYVFSSNGVYDPYVYGYDGFAKIVVDVPQSVTGFTEKEVTEGIRIVNLSNSASYVRPYVFEKDTYLQTVYLPNCTSVGEQAFALCRNLTTVSLPTCQTVGSDVFQNCPSLSQVSLPLCESIVYEAFVGCRGLSSLNLPVCNYIGDWAFANFRRSFSLTLGCSSVVTIFAETFYNTTVYAYVPASLVDAYKSAPYWSDYSDRIFPISE